MERNRQALPGTMGEEPTNAAADSDLACQSGILQSVSRTYALTIPALPAGLRDAVANAYLLCRITDTIEDEPNLSPAQKRVFWERFVDVVAGRAGAGSFARDLSAALSPATPAPEHDLVSRTSRIVRVTARFNARRRAAIERCLRTMSEGMVEFQGDGSSVGLADMEQLDRYCYVAAGVVGEMLVELFGDHSAAVDELRGELLPLARSHAQGLQMTNILMDVWDDWRHGACWLPRDVFDASGFDLRGLSRGGEDPGFAAGMSRMVGIARGHLANALRFTLLIPPRETGIRRHLLWALGLAVLTLRRLHASRSFRRGRSVRVSRFGAGVMILLASAFVRRDSALELLFRGATRPLPGA